MNEITNVVSQLDAERNRSLLNRDFLLITVSSFFYFFNFHTFILLSIRIQGLGGGASVIGFVMGIHG